MLRESKLRDDRHQPTRPDPDPPKPSGQSQQGGGSDLDAAALQLACVYDAGCDDGSWSSLREFVLSGHDALRAVHADVWDAFLAKSGAFSATAMLYPPPEIHAASNVYRMSRWLGKGCYGQVWQAKQVSSRGDAPLQRDVAIKFVQRGRADEAAAPRPALLRNPHPTRLR